MAGKGRDPLDYLLDDALATYANQDPRPGLERRVLNRIRSEGARPGFPILGWALPITAMGCLLAGIAVWNHRVPAPAAPDMVRTEASRRPGIVATTEPVRPLRRQPGRARHASVPKQAEFPIRAPLTHQERA